MSHMIAAAFCLYWGAPRSHNMASFLWPPIRAENRYLIKCDWKNVLITEKLSLGKPKQFCYGRQRNLRYKIRLKQEWRVTDTVEVKWTELNIYFSLVWVKNCDACIPMLRICILKKSYWFKVLPLKQAKVVS